MDFDFQKGGNVVGSRYLPKRSGSPQSRGTYRWRPLGTVFVPESLQYVHDVVSGPGKTRKEEISVKVKEIDLREEAESFFRWAAITKMLPADTMVEDRIQKRRYRLNPEAIKIEDEALDRLSNLLGSRGFLQK